MDLLTVVPISQCACISKHHDVHCTYIQLLFVKHTSVKLGIKLLFIKTILHSLIMGTWMAKESLTS